MTGRLAGKVALITGAARGIGRAQSLRFAQEGADVIALDICGPIETVAVPASTPEDLDQTARLVREGGGRIVTDIVDVRDADALREVTDRGATAFGGSTSCVRLRESRLAGSRPTCLSRRGRP